MEAYKAIESMRRRGIILSPYLDTRMVEDIYKVGGWVVMGNPGARLRGKTASRVSAKHRLHFPRIPG
jgi:hypothetical protein